MKNLTLLIFLSAIIFSFSICYGQNLTLSIEDAEQAFLEKNHIEILELEEEYQTPINGFTFIRKAKLKYLEGKYKFSLRLLEKAEKMHLGSCGVSEAEAKAEIGYLKTKNYFQLQEFQLARNSIDMSKSYYKINELDSLRIISYQLELGRESLKDMIDPSLINASIECGDVNCYIVIPLINNINTLRFKLSDLESLLLYDDYSDTTNKKNIEERIELWKKGFLNSNYYKMIKE